MTRTRKTPQQRAVDDLELADRVAARAEKKRDATKAAADKAQKEFDEAALVPLLRDRPHHPGRGRRPNR